MEISLNLDDIYLMRAIRKKDTLPHSTRQMAKLLDKSLICYSRGNWYLTRKGRFVLTRLSY